MMENIQRFRSNIESNFTILSWSNINYKRRQTKSIYLRVIWKFLFLEQLTTIEMLNIAIGFFYFIQE